MRRIGLLAAVLLLTACTPGATRWTKAGATQDTTDHDYAECASEAREATRGNDWQRTGTLRLQEDTMAHSRRVRAADVIAHCMGAKGYLRTG